VDRRQGRGDPVPPAPRCDPCPAKLLQRAPFLLATTRPEWSGAVFFFHRQGWIRDLRPMRAAVRHLRSRGCEIGLSNVLPASPVWFKPRLDDIGRFSTHALSVGGEAGKTVSRHNFAALARAWCRTVRRHGTKVSDPSLTGKTPHPFRTIPGVVFAAKGHVGKQAGQDHNAAQRTGSHAALSDHTIACRRSSSSIGTIWIAALMFSCCGRCDKGATF